MTPSLNLIGSVIRSKARFVDARSGTMTQFNLGIDYFLSKRTDVYGIIAANRAEGMYNTGIYNSAIGDDRQQVVRVGIRHRF